MSLSATLRSYLNDTARAFDRAPVEGCMAVFAAVCLSYSIEVDHSPDEAVRAVVAAVLIAFSAWSATLLHAMGSIRSRTRWIVNGAAGAAGAAYMLFTGDFGHETEGWRAFMLMGAAILIAFSVPGWARAAGDPVLRLRRINARITLRMAGIILYGLALFAGLAVALAAIDNLFELHLDGDIYGHAFVWIMAVLVPLVIVGGLDDYVSPIDVESDVARVVHRLAGFLLPPLVAIYFLILCVYVVRILLTRELPQNLVSPMVIAAGILGCLSLMVFDPPADSGVGRRWLRFTPIAFLALTPLGMWALLARIDDYGWTEFRLLRMIALAVLAALALPAAVLVLRRRTLDLRVIPVAFAVALLLGAVGPWSVSAVSRRDQQQRLASALSSADIDPATLSMPRDTVLRVVPGPAYDRIVGASSYLRSHHGPSALTAVVPAYPDESAYTDYTDFAARFHIAPSPGDSTASPSRGLYARLGTGARIPTEDGAMYRIMTAGRQDVPAITRIAGDTLLIGVEGDTIVVDLEPAIRGAIAQDGAQSAIAPATARLPAMSRTGVQRGYFVILDLNGGHENGRRTVTFVDGLLTLQTRAQPGMNP